jgi:hypothetical protein
VAAVNKNVGDDERAFKVMRKAGVTLLNSDEIV